MKKVLGCMRRACDEFNMIQPGDKIAVGVSGGKDSMLLAHGLALYKRYMKIDFELCAITVDLGFDGYDTKELAEFLENDGIPYYVAKSEIGNIVFNIRKEKNPCALCAKMRKGVFYEYAESLGCNKAAYGHQLEDVIETLLMSLFYESRINTFSPVTYLSKRNITLIRPFIYLPEKDVIGAVRKYNIPIRKNPCPASGVTKREEIKQLIKELSKTNPNIKKNLIAAVRNTQNYNLWDKCK